MFCPKNPLFTLFLNSYPELYGKTHWLCPKSFSWPGGVLASAHIAPWSLLLILRNFTSQLLNCCELEIDHTGTTYSGKKQTTKANSTNQ